MFTKGAKHLFPKWNPNCNHSMLFAFQRTIQLSKRGGIFSLFSFHCWSLIFPVESTICWKPNFSSSQWTSSDSSASEFCPPVRYAGGRVCKHLLLGRILSKMSSLLLLRLTAPWGDPSPLNCLSNSVLVCTWKYSQSVLKIYRRENALTFFFNSRWQHQKIENQVQCLDSEILNLIKWCHIICF